MLLQIWQSIVFKLLAKDTPFAYIICLNRIQQGGFSSELEVEVHRCLSSVKSRHCVKLPTIESGKSLKTWLHPIRTIPYPNE